MKEKIPPARHSSPEELDDFAKATVDILYKEFQRIQAKSVSTDDWFFRYLSIAVVPFLGFLGYAAISPQYRILVAALPVLSVIGLLVVLVLSSHYVYVSSYGNYLQREINRLLRSETMRDTCFSTAAYEKFTPVRVSFAVGFVLLFFVNVTAAPFITRVVHDFSLTHGQSLGPARVVLQYYWTLSFLFIAITAIPAVASLLATQRRLRALLESTSGQMVEDRATTAPVAPEVTAVVTTADKPPAAEDNHRARNRN
jgi:hypothetical protein